MLSLSFALKEVFALRLNYRGEQISLPEVNSQTACFSMLRALLCGAIRIARIMTHAAIGIAGH